MAARVLQEAEVSNSAINLKFNYTLDVAHIVNAAFVLTIPDATPSTVTDPFIDIDLVRDYNSIGRILSLYFTDTLVPATTYRVTVTGLKSVNGAVLEDDHFEFTTSSSVDPDPQDLVPEAEVIVVQDYSIKNVSNVTNSNIATNDDRLVISEVTPESNDARYLSVSYKNGIIQVQFNRQLAANYLTAEFFTLQKKAFSGYISRWEDVLTEIHYDSQNYRVLICLPSTEADQEVVYMTADRTYWEKDYKYRLRINSKVSPANESIIETETESFTYDLTCYQGSSFTRVITLTNSNGSVFDLSGFTARMQVRPSIYSDIILIELTTENGRILLDESEGTVSILLTALETSSISDSGVYDLEIVSPLGIVTKPLFGNFLLIPEVTR